MKLKKILPLIAFGLNCSISFGQWSTDPAVNNIVCSSSGNQTESSGVADGTGAVITVWKDYTFGATSDISAQKIDAQGNIVWNNNGVVICNEDEDQLQPVICADGYGGAIIVWTDNRSGSNTDIYAQRIDANGIVQWATNGVVVCSNSFNQSNPKVITAGFGSVIIVWSDSRNGNTDIFAQALDVFNGGSALWANDGVSVCSSNGAQLNHVLVSDGAAGAIIAWQDKRALLNDDIYAQRIDGLGVAQWALDGISVCSAPGNQSNVKIVSDANNGAVLVWEDLRNSQYDIYASNINFFGTEQWSVNGEVICVAQGNQRFPQIVFDNTGNYLLAWEDDNSGDRNVYAQKLDYYGSAIWNPSGVIVCSESDEQVFPLIIEDGLGGAIISWSDYRTGDGYSDIYAQKINQFGLVQWVVNGVGVTTANDQQSFPVMVSDNNNGAIFVWTDNRQPPEGDIYAQRIYKDGFLCAPISVQLGSDIEQCATSEIILDAGNSGSVFLWSTGQTLQNITVNTTGVYSVLVTSSGGCTARDTIDIVLNSLPIVDLGIDIVQCGGTIDIDAINSGAVFIWNTGSTDQVITVSASGVYSVEVTDANGCYNTDTISVTINDLPVVVYNEVNDTVCLQNGSFNLTIANLPGGTYSGTSVVGDVFDPLISGTGLFNIIYVYTDMNGCTNSDTSQILVDNCVGMKENNEGFDYQIRNCGGKMIEITSALEILSVDIFDLTGKTILSEKLSSHKCLIPMDEFGLFFIKATTVKGVMMKKHLVNF